MSAPTLPEQDANSSARKAQLEKAREKYEFDQSFYGYSLVKNVPKEAHFSAGYLATATEHLIRISGNQLGATVSGVAAEEAKDIAEKIRSWFTKTDPAAVAEAHAQLNAQGAGGLLREHPLSLSRYEGLYPALPKPASMTSWKEDWYFAWQRIAGCNPILISGVDRFPSHFPVTDAHLKQAAPDDSLAAAGAEGRLFLVDYPMMADVPVGNTDGRPKRLTAPMAAFVCTKEGTLLPFAIQCGQAPGANVPVYGPKDGFAWQMAKTQVQVADANFQGIVSHLGYCHLVMESTIIAAERQLAAVHPIKVLLRPHFEFTLAANDVAKRTLIGPGGNTDRLQSGTIEGSTQLVQKCLAEYPIHRIDAPTAFADRRVDNAEALPEYPFRDDALSTYKPIHKWVDSYLRLYYKQDSDVSGDEELHAWVRDMGDPKAGNLFEVIKGARLETIEDLVMHVTRIVYTATTYHSAINYASWDFLGYPPNMPAAAWGPGPSPRDVRKPDQLDLGLDGSEEALFELMTPLDLSFATIKLMWTIMMTKNHLGKYPEGHFTDPQVAPLLKTFQAALVTAENEVKARNEKRRVPYTYLTPSWIPASIHV